MVRINRQWQLLLPVPVTAVWNGGDDLVDIKIDCIHPYQAVSNFRNGILTFDVAYIFRTLPGYHLLVTGPTNSFKDAIAPMTAIVETDWLPYSFTFNYQFTRPERVEWGAGEPYVQICVVSAGFHEQIQPVIRRLSDNPQLADDLEQWWQRRTNFRARQKAGDPAAWQEAWGKD